MFSKIVVGIDGSQTSENAVRLAYDLAQKYASELHLVHTRSRKPLPLRWALLLGITL
jgi:nucleotide-binding universal stress UspA family protein